MPLDYGKTVCIFKLHWVTYSDDVTGIPTEGTNFLLFLWAVFTSHYQTLVSYIAWWNWVQLYFCLWYVDINLPCLPLCYDNVVHQQMIRRWPMAHVSAFHDRITPRGLHCRLLCCFCKKRSNSICAIHWDIVSTCEYDILYANDSCTMYLISVMGGGI